MRTPAPDLPMFLACPPGLEPAVAAEAAAAGFDTPRAVPGGVETRGGWREIWRANLTLRTPTRVLARIAAFPAFHLAQLDKRARKVAWGEVLRRDVPVSVDTVTSRKSRIYHAGAATQRIERAIAETLGAPVGPGGVQIRARIEDNLVTISVDTSGEPLHRRGFKQAVGKAPLRETMAAAFLRQARHDVTAPLVDPMCGSGTFVIEAAEIAAGLLPGRARDFVFERLATFDSGAWKRMKSGPQCAEVEGFFGYDRDQGAVRMAAGNAARAGLEGPVFACRPITELTPPEGPAGLVMVNPPYGARIGNRGALFGVYASLGAVLNTRFRGWRLGLVTSDAALARATDLPLRPAGPPVPHGPLRITLWLAGPL